MNHTNLISRAWRITWRHKVLWIFGILLALTGGGEAAAAGTPFPAATSRRWARCRRFPAWNVSIPASGSASRPSAAACCSSGSSWR